LPWAVIFEPFGLPDLRVPPTGSNSKTRSYWPAVAGMLESAFVDRKLPPPHNSDREPPNAILEVAKED